MYRTYRNQLQLDFSKSRIFFLYLFFISLLCGSSLLLSAIDIVLKTLIILLILAVFVVTLKNRACVSFIKWNKDNHWQVGFVNGEVLNASVLDSSFVSRFVCVLNFRLDNGKKISYAIFPDSISSDKMRYLLLRFNIEKAVLFKK